VTDLFLAYLTTLFHVRELCSDVSQGGLWMPVLGRTFKNEVIKRPGREADHAPPSSAEVTNAWSCTSTPRHVFRAYCVFKHRDLL